MKSIPCSSFEDFLEHADKEIDWTTQKRIKSTDFIPDVYFRGQSDPCWELETTLERYIRTFLERSCDNITEHDYYNIMKRVESDIHSLTCSNLTLPMYRFFPNPSPPVGYELMIYLRHHGFPSPLLDWSRSPHIAAFFAFEKATKEEVAIYMYRDSVNGVKSGWAGDVTIYSLGSNVHTHSRHFQQQAEYTMCYSNNGKAKTICSHENATHSDKECCSENGQCILEKYTVKVNNKLGVLRKLDLMNINKYTLFGGDEALMDMLANRAFAFDGNFR